MNWNNLLNEGRIRKHKTSPRELDDIRALIQRDIKDAKIKQLSSDRRFATAYNACLQAAKMAIACCGYRVRGAGAHHTTFQAIRTAMGKSIKLDAIYLDKCRAKRNKADYDAAGRVSKKEAEELLEVAQSFVQKVESWIENNYPEYSRGE